jgi:signal recognition particle receptor subunit beta
MVELNHRERTIKVKVVYYGPAAGGKTTNLQVLHQHADAARRGELVSVNSAQDRTILFDLLPLKAAGFRGFDLRLQIVTVPGQAMYAATRRLALKHSDSIVFVANSAADRWEENVQSFREMTENLISHQLDPSTLPLVLQYNKRDLPEVTPAEFMDRTLNARHVEAIPAVAVRGEGVLETFSAILHRTMADLAARYQLVGTAAGGQLQDWTKNAMVSMFGTTSLLTIGGPAVAPAQATFEAPSGPPPDRRVIKVSQPEDAVRRAGLKPDARANETLVDSYAEASAQLATEAGQLREERDLLRRRITDVRQTLAAAQDVLAGRPLDAALRAILGPMCAAAGVSHASFLLPGVDRTFRPAVLRALAEDPLLRTRAGVRHAADKLFHDQGPRLQRAADVLDLGDALASREPTFSAVLSVPVRTPRGLQGLALLYYDAEEALPPDDTLEHLAMLARAIGPSLDLASSASAVRASEKALHMAIVGAASLHGMEDALTSILLVRERLAGMRKRADLPLAVQGELGRLGPLLTEALAVGRSLVSFGRGEVQREVVELDRALAELRQGGIEVQTGPGAGAVLADPVLFRMAVRSLLEHVRGTSSNGALLVRASAESGRISLRVGGGGAAGAPPAAASGQPVDLRLALVQKIAQLHGGHVATETDEAGRSWTTLTLPAA